MSTETIPPKKRKSRTSDLQRTMAYLKVRGWLCAITEKWNPHAFCRQDLFGCIDILAVMPLRGVVGIQSCSGGATDTGGGDLAKHLLKCAQEPRLITWLNSGGQFWVLSWRKGAARPGSRSLWRCRVMVARVVGGNAPSPVRGGL